MIETSSSAVVFWLFAADFPWQSSAQCYFTKNLDILAFSELYKAPVCSRRFGSRSVVPPTCRLKKFSNNGADSNPSTSLASHSCNSMVEPWWYNRVTPPNPKCHCEKDATYIYIYAPTRKNRNKKKINVEPKVVLLFICKVSMSILRDASSVRLGYSSWLWCVRCSYQWPPTKRWWKCGWFSPI